MDKSFQKVRKPSGKSCSYELSPIPNFSLEALPFLFMRDDKQIYLICTREGSEKVTALSQARYESKQSYKTMEVICDRDGGDEFDVALITHLSDQTSRVVMFHFDEDFISKI